MPQKVRSTAPTNQDDYSLLRESPIQYLRTVVVQFVQGLFWYLPKGHNHWEPNIGESEIFISDEAPIRTKELGQLPGILITRSAMSMSSLGLDDMMSYDQRTDAKTKSVIVPGTISVNCCSRVPQESENLCYFVAKHLWLLRDVLQRKSLYNIGQNIGIGAPSPAGSLVAGDMAEEFFVTAATMPFQLIETGTVTPLGQKIAKDIELRLHGGPMRIPASVSGSPVTTDTSTATSPSSTGYASLQAPGVSIRGVPLRPPRIRGRTLPLVASDVGQSISRGQAPLAQKK